MKTGAWDVNCNVNMLTHLHQKIHQVISSNACICRRPKQYIQSAK